MSLERASKSVYLCARCGYCRDMVRARDNTNLMCPLCETTSGFESFISRGKNWILRLVLEGKLSPEQFSEKFVDHIYTCLLCGNCTEHCLVLRPESWVRFPKNAYEDHLINNDQTTMALRTLVIEQGNPPVLIQKVLENVYRYGNPLGEPSEKRVEYLKDVDFAVPNASKKKCDVLLYLGSVASYNARNMKTIKALMEILKASGTDFGVLGKEEVDSGGLVLELGEEGLSRDLARRNADLFQKLRVNKIVCLSPHDYYAFTHYYPETLKQVLRGIEVQHYTQFLLNLVQNGKLKIKTELEKTITFHDPCYLGRKSGIYEPPRKLLQLSGAKLVEMDLSHGNAYCCGGGGGGLWYEPVDDPKIENERAKQALSTGAEILAAACPQCAQMLEDGLKAIEGKIKLMDVAEIIAEALNNAVWMPNNFA